MNIDKLMTAEAWLINSMFRRNDIKAKVNQKQSYQVETGFLHYALTLHPATRFAEVERLQRELSVALSTSRRRFGLPEVQALPVDTPSFAVETPHPAPKLLLWSPRSITTTAPHTMLLGRSYVGQPANEASTFDDSCHVLIAGITGSGKSVLMQHMLLSLCANTSPAELRLVLVDLKNEDLLPFRNLPHVMQFAGTKDQAVDAIQFVATEKQKRVEQPGYKPYRLVLVIDEMAQLATMRDCVDALGDLASIGRSKWINLIGATQTPTEKGGLGSLLKANFPLRLVGMVAPGQSYAATGRAGLHADLLPGRGAFLRLQGSTVKRFQSFFIDGDDVGLMCRKITNHWGAVPKTLSADNNNQPLPTIAPAIVAPVASIQFPIGAARPLTDPEAQNVRQLAESGQFDHNGKVSLSRLAVHVFGFKDGKTLPLIKEIIEGVQI